MSSKVAAVAVPRDPLNELARTQTDEQCRTVDWIENTNDKIFIVLCVYLTKIGKASQVEEVKEFNNILKSIGKIWPNITNLKITKVKWRGFSGGNA